MEAGPEQKHGTAILAGGCFWCMEPVFDTTPGVISVTPGDTGGSTADPGYQEVMDGESGHLEAVRTIFDPVRVSYRELLTIFWCNFDPTTRNPQFCDFGSQYQSAVFYLNEEQKKVAEESRRELEETIPFDRLIVTEIRPVCEFYPAEEYHHQFYLKNPMRYRAYHEGCGRKGRLKELWGG